MVERHPFGSQAFIPQSPRPFLVVVCHDGGSGPGEPHAFLTHPGQGVNYPRNRWHGVLTPIGEDQDFVVVDRGGDGNNLEEHVFGEPYEVHLPVEE
jgi:ureidoglycolate lyase